MEPDDLVSAAEVGEWVDLHERQVRDLASKGVIEREGRGRYRLKATVRLIHTHIREAAAGRGPGAGSGPDLATERALLARAQRVAQEERNAVSRRQLISIEGAIGVVAPALLIVRNGVLAIPNRATSLLIGVTEPAQVSAILTDLVHEVLTGISDMDPFVQRLRGGQQPDTEAEAPGDA